MCIPCNGGHPFRPTQELAPFQQTVPRWVSLLNDTALHQTAALWGRLAVTWPLHHISDIVLYYRMISIPCQVESGNFAEFFVKQYIFMLYVCCMLFLYGVVYYSWWQAVKTKSEIEGNSLTAVSFFCDKFLLTSYPLLHYNRLRFFIIVLRWRRKVNPYRFTRESMPWLKACFESDVLKFPPELLHWISK